MSQVIAIVILVSLCRNVFSLQCIDNMVGDCQCGQDKRATYQFHCPSYQPDKKKLEVLVKSGVFAQVTCARAVTSEDIFNYLNQLQLGLIKTLKFKGCPLPGKSYQQALIEMGVSGVQRLWIDAAKGQNFNSNLLKNLTVRALDLAYFDNLEIDKDIFKNSRLIEQINLNRIRGLTLHKDSFENLPLLTHLTLHSCGISSLDKDIFRNQTNIKELSLHGNDLIELPDGIFDNLRNLTKINLGANQLRKLPNNIFQFNDQIQETILSFNCFESLPENLFRGKQKLHSFDFRRTLRKSKCINESTDLKLPESMFQNSSIREIKFLHINVRSVPTNYLKGCKELKTIVIQSGNIGTIPRDLFQDTPSIEKIDFVNNKINNIFIGTFRGLNKLSTLRLMYNNISSLDPELFTDTKSLKTLHLSYNNIDDKIGDLFDGIKKIEEVDLSNNRLRKVPDVFVQGFDSLTKLKLSHNSITSFNMEHLSNLTSLSTLDLNANSISGYLEMIDTVPTKTKVVINLSRNKLKGVILSKNTMDIKNVKLVLSDNPLICDCFATEVKELNEEVQLMKKNVIVDQNDFLCGKGKNLQQTSFSELTCSFPSELLNESCPNNCTCKLNRYSRRISVFCSGQSLTQIPPKLPAIPREADGIILHLENNLLSNLTESLQKSSEGTLSKTDLITELHLTGNKLRYVSEKYMPRNLEYLAVDDNNIHHFSNSTIQYFKNKVESSNFSLKLGKNPYDCNCNSLELLHFLKMFYSHVEDYQTLTTKCLEESKKLLTQNEDDFCPSKSPTISVLLPIVILLIIMFIAILLHIFYKETLMIYIFSKSWGKFFFSEDHMDKNKPYDAFISYSHHDSEFAEMKLLPGLESEENPKEHQYKCLIHTRDWNVGEMISDQIIESVDRSRRTIIVLTKGYIQSMWSKLEFRAAHRKAMKENTQRVIIILHGDKLTKGDLDEDLQKYISSNTYIDSKDPWFWRKLRYALPKKSRKQKEKIKKLHDNLKDKENNDKSEKDNCHDSSSQDKINLPYHTQMSREMLLPSESLKLHLDGTEYMV